MYILFKNAIKAVIPKILELMRQFSSLFNYDFKPEERSFLLDTFLNNQFFGHLWLIYVGHNGIGYFVMTFGFSFEYKGRDAVIDE